MDKSIEKILANLTGGHTLTFEEAKTVGLAMSDGALPPSVVGAFLGGLAARGETGEEIAGFVAALRTRMRAVETTTSTSSGAAAPLLVDTCGTGGDGRGTFNVSTLTAIVLAGAGLAVAKHGNRSVTSSCGSADVLETLGVNLELTPERAAEVLAEAGMVFLFAPLFHPSMKHVVPIRRELKVRTLFNLLGPLLNPMPVAYQLIGISHKALMERYASVLRHTNLRAAWIVHSEDGLDEISLCAPTHVTAYQAGEAGAEPSLKKFVIDPREYGLELVSAKELLGGDREASALLARRILDADEPSEKSKDAALVAKRNMVALNAAALLVMTGHANDLTAGIAAAREVISSGKAQSVLTKLIATSHNQS